MIAQAKCAAPTEMAAQNAPPLACKDHSRARLVSAAAAATDVVVVVVVVVGPAISLF